MASGSFSRVTNDAANRAEAQRDKMLDYLKTIASKGNERDLDAIFEN